MSALAVDPTGRQLVTAGADSQIKVGLSTWVASVRWTLPGCPFLEPASALPHPSEKAGHALPGPPTSGCAWTPAKCNLLLQVPFVTQLPLCA